MKLFVTIILLLVSVRSFGQWTVVNINMNNTFVDVQFINDSVGFISGNFGAVLKTTDYGLTWINTNNTGSTNNFRFHFPGDSVGYALGGNYLYKTINQGDNWFSLPVVITWDKGNIFFINDSTGFFLASYGVIFKTTDGGMNWNNINTGCSATIVEEDIFFQGQDSGYFGGWYTSCASRTTDGGDNWQTMPNNMIYMIKSIHFPSANTGYIAGDGVEKTIDGGNNWVLQSIPVNMLNSIYCTDINTCYAVGPGGAIIKTTDGGSNWLQQISPTTQALRKIFCTDANTCYAVGDSGTVLKTINGGVTGLANVLPAVSDIIFPNPASNYFTVNLNLSDFEVEIYNDLGKKITKTKNQKQIDVSFLCAGIYFVKVNSDEKSYSQKIIIE